MTLITFILACYGMTMIVVYGKIFEAIRPQHHFFKCTMCMGFWVGVINAVCFFEMPFSAFAAGCISSGTSYFISRLVNDDGIAINLKKQ